MGGEDNASQTRHEARYGPGQCHHSAGIDAVELDQAAAFHRGPHLQAQVRESQHCGQCDEDHHGDADDRKVDAVYRCAQYRDIDDIRIEKREDCCSVVKILRPEEDRQQRGDADQHGDRNDQLRRGIRVRDSAE